MWELDYKENWALKNWCFWTVVLEKTLESPLDRTGRRYNLSILKEISPEYSLEGLMLKLKLQYFGHLMRRADSFEKILILGKIDSRRRRRWQRMWWSLASLTQWTWVWVSSGSWWWTGRPGMLQSMGLQRVEHDWVIDRNWTELMLVLPQAPSIYSVKEQADGQTEDLSFIKPPTRVNKEGRLESDYFLIDILALFPKVLGTGVTYENKYNTVWQSKRKWQTFLSFWQRTRYKYLRLCHIVCHN